LYNPQATSCTVSPYPFHPMYSTSSEHTRNPALAHSFNISFVEEIGHFAFCDDADPNTFACTAPGLNDKGAVDADDVACFTPSQIFFPPAPIVQIGGCTASDIDFDGVSYDRSWPGTLRNWHEDREVHPTPVRLTSPLFLEAGEHGEGPEIENYDRVAFEADLPLIESATVPACDTFAGTNCENPPAGAKFYPIFSIAKAEHGVCEWQFGGKHIPGTTNTFGGNSTEEFGALLPLVVQDFSASITEFNTFRRILDENPCPTAYEVVQRRHLQSTEDENP
jgi:hypothetical protein